MAFANLLITMSLTRIATGFASLLGVFLGPIVSPLWSQAVATSPYGVAGYLPPEVTTSAAWDSLARYSGTTLPFYYFHGPVLAYESYRGRISSANGLVLTDEGATWTEGQFTSRFTGGYPSDWLQIKSGPYAGLPMEILANGVTTLTVDRLPPGADLTGASYVVYGYHASSLAAIIGEYNQSGFLAGTEEVATRYGFWDREQYRELYFTGARFRLVGDPVTDQANAPVNLDYGLFFRFTNPLLSTGATSYYTATLFETRGDLTTGPLGVWIDAGYNLVNPRAAVDLTLATSNLYTGDAATGLKAGAPTNADIVSLYDGRGFVDYYVRKTAAGVLGWRKAGDVATDCGNVVIPAGSAFTVRRVGDPRPFLWLRPALYSDAPDVLPEGTPLPASASDPTALTYDEWAAVTIPTGERSPYADNDGDGRVNLLEYFLGGNPLVRDTVSFAYAVKEPGSRYGRQPYLALDFRVPRAVKGVSFAVETSSDLVLWASVPSVHLAAFGGVNSISAADWTSSPVQTGYLFPFWNPRRFIRLVVRLQTPSIYDPVAVLR